MKKSELTQNPEVIAQIRIWEQFNLSVNNEEQRRCSAFRRFKNPEAARLMLTSSMWTKVLAWYQDAEALTALYSYRGAYVLLDRYYDDEIGDIEDVFCIVAKTQAELFEALSILEKSQKTQSEQTSLFEGTSD